ncbi:MAG: SDR family NAD(P)-dependent oxidoreductase [Deltaproteobacteria bacterium]|nr:SDR family NAD(P)-dependent oxidoreductase [Deltaproteobacteria bacterium]
MSDLRFDQRVAIVTGAGGGLGRSHALLLASRGARVVVNDLGGSATGGGKSSAAADRVVEEIKKAGGEAVANYDSVEDGAKIVQTALDTWGRLDIVVNNAGILRDTSFQKMTQEDWELIYRIHVLGSFRVTHAAWNHLRDAGYGRIVFTASAAGIYGNFGQANYSMAKLGLLGLSNTLAIEGRKKNVLVNTIAPIAGSRLTETVLPKELVDALKPEFVSPLVAYLCHESCEETGGLYEVGGGFMGKLRWERSEGHCFKLSKLVTPDAVAAKWSAIAGFEKTTHPTDITASMQPILGNLGTAKSKGGGNELIDVDEALGFELPPVTSSYDERDLALYALGVGAGQNPLDGKELGLVYENWGDGFHALGSFAVVPALNAIMSLAKQGKQAPGLNYGLERILHGEQYTEIRKPLPPRAKLTHKARIKDIFDKGKHALVVTEIKTLDESGEELAVNELTAFVRGAGGWGGERGPSAEVNVPPDRAPDAVVTEKTSPGQALLYRLSGDWNPLHADPGFAKAFGFERPILHGLCTFGYATRHVIANFAGGDPRLFKSIKVRFADTVFPGETIVTEMWKESDTRIVFRCKVAERDRVALSNAAIELFSEIPRPKAAEPAATAPAAAPAGEIHAADIFLTLRQYIADHPELVGKVGTVFQFKFAEPPGAWALDLKNGAGAVTEGTVGGADVTLELADADFVGMAMGKLNPQKLYFGGKLKISGNVMASQKLDFLTKIDPAELQKAAVKAGRIPGSTPGGAPAAGPPAAGGSQASMSAAIFGGIKGYVEAHPELAGKVGTVFQFKLSEPESAWAIDLKNGGGTVISGAVEKPDVTLSLSDSDFVAMCTGQADPQKLYFGGKLKLSGNVMAAQKLDFLKKIDPAEVAKAMTSKKPAAPAATAAPPAAPKEAKSPAIFKALEERLAKNPKLAAEVGKLVQFAVSSPDRSWVVDLRSGAGAVREGTDAQAAATFRIDDEDLAVLAKDPQKAKDLFMHGKLRVDGDIRLAHKLGFLNGL